ncbi:MAG: GspE/PulE family protein [Chitinophagales bacterium]
MINGSRKMVGEMLKEIGLISNEQLHEALAEQKESRDKLGNILVKKGYITEQALLETLEFMLGIPYVKLDRYTVDPGIMALIPTSMAQRHQVLPLAINENKLTVGMVDPMNFVAVEDIHALTGMEIIPVLISARELELVTRQYSNINLDPGMENIFRELSRDAESAAAAVDDVGDIVDDAPVVKIVNSILNQAVLARASDIHMEPEEQQVRIRMRVDGKLTEILSLPKKVGPALASRVKIMATMDIAEKRLPQDGRMRTIVSNREINYRVSTLPTMYGEKVVIRILDRAQSIVSIDKLGLDGNNKEFFDSFLKRPNGIILVTGPTGSGKTTTLYAALQHLNSPEKNIITLEDPVEYSFRGINQVQTNPRAGLTFATGLRSVLRQDPDIIMVGEIRDTETARLAVQAALTGHLVLSTVHTNSAVGTISRLVDMGIEPFLLSSTLVGVIAQRLVRALCQNCTEQYELDELTALRMGIPGETGKTFYRGKGCSFCRNTGYRGRLAVHEALRVDRQVISLMTRGAPEEDILQAALSDGMVTLYEDGLQKARNGLTSLEDVLTVVRITE